MKSLVIYYSRNGENYFGGTIKYIEKGNTEIIALKLKKMTNSDIFCCEQITPYSMDYRQCVKEAHDDYVNHHYPQIKPFNLDLKDYDLIYLCYPNYCGTMPMAMFSLLKDLDLKGKIIKPLCTHEGSGLANSENDIKKLCPNSIIKPGIAIKGSNVESEDLNLEKWINE